MSKGSNSKANKENKKAKKSNKKNKSASVATDVNAAADASVDELANHKLSKTKTSTSLNLNDHTAGVATTPSDSIQSERVGVDVLSTTTGLELVSYANGNQTLESNLNANKGELNDTTNLTSGKNEALKANTSSTSSLSNATTPLSNGNSKYFSNGQGIKIKASSKSNDRFHQLFPSVSIDEFVIDTYSCAFVKSLNLYQGVMFLTQNYICFYSKIITHETILIIKLTDIKEIMKTMHAVIFPTAIRINTQNSSYSFTSFISRSHTLEHLNFLLLKARERQNDQTEMKNKVNQLSRSETCNNNNTTNHHNEQILKLNQSLPECNRLAKLSQQMQQKPANFYLNNSDETNNSTNSLTHDQNNNKLDTLSIETTIINDLNNVNEELEEYEADGKLDDNCVDDNSDDVKMIMLAKTSSKTSKEANHGNSMLIDENSKRNASFYNVYNRPNLIYDFDCDLSKNMVRVSLRHKRTLLQKAKILLSLLIPGFFDMSRLDALLPICFIMCILLLLNAFVLLNKVNQVDDLFTEILSKQDF